MQWPIEIYNILEQYYLYSKMAPAESTNNRRRNLVRRLKTAYDELPFAQKVDVLVPADYHFLTEDAVKSDPISGLVNGYSIWYQWPDNDGFDGAKAISSLAQDEIYDRIGGEEGSFLTPLLEGKTQTFLMRAIPYYVPEQDITSNPSYHQFRVKVNYESQVFRGRIAPAFWHNPNDGGGVQVKIGKTIKVLKRLGVLEDVKREYEARVHPTELTTL